MVEHFLLVGSSIQGHINPLLQLARRLLRAGEHVTFSTAISAHKLMFPERSSTLDLPMDDPDHPRLSYFPYSDGYDDGYDKTKHSLDDFFATRRIICPWSLHSIASAPSTDKKPAITFIIYAVLIPWVAEVAAELDLPIGCLWTQPAAVFTIYYHYFHGGYKDIIASHSDDLSYSLQPSGMSPISIRDLPSCIVPKPEVDKLTRMIRCWFEEMFLNERRSAGVVETVLVNSFHDLEPDVFMAIDKNMFNVIPIGPLIPSPTDGTLPENVVKETTDANECMEWLNRWAENCVVYLSFGSLSFLKKEQNAEFSHALRDCGRPYLWVVRGDKEGVENVEKEKGMVVSWCSQMEVLSHTAVGCFVTHCGWNSTLESIASGVPMISFPQWSDQPTNAKLVEGTWKNGVRAEVDGDGVVTSTELSRCLETVMGDGEKGQEIRENAKKWKEKTRMSVMDGESSDLNLMDFVKNIRKYK